MADYVTKIRTEHGDKQIDYNALANLPKAPTIESIGAAPTNHKHKQSDISDFPTSLPASGGDADTVDGKHASDFALASDVENISLESFGVTATAEELNRIKGITSEIQAQLNEKASTNHTHTASEVGASASDHTHELSVLGAAASDHSHTAKEIGAMPTTGGTMTGTLKMNGGDIVLKEGKNYGTESQRPVAGIKGRIYLQKVVG